MSNATSMLAGERTQHTPGPWIYHHDTQSVEIGTEEVYCADVSPCTASFEEAKANARLIAAAPELLKALKLAAAGLSVANLEESEACRKARAAIAKAEGK